MMGRSCSFPFLKKQKAAAAWEMRSGGGGCRIRGECPPVNRLAQCLMGMQENPVELRFLHCHKMKILLTYQCKSSIIE